MIEFIVFINLINIKSAIHPIYKFNHNVYGIVSQGSLCWQTIGTANKSFNLALPGSLPYYTSHKQACNSLNRNNPILVYYYMSTYFPDPSFARIKSTNMIHNCAANGACTASRYLTEPTVYFWTTRCNNFSSHKRSTPEVIWPPPRRIQDFPLVPTRRKEPPYQGKKITRYAADACTASRYLTESTAYF